MSALVTWGEITPFKLPPGQRVSFGGGIYECIGKTADAKKLMRVDRAAGEVWVENGKLVLMMATGELRLAPDASTPACRVDLQQKEFSSLPEAVKRRAYMRRDYAEALIENARLGYPRTTADVIKAVFRKRVSTAGNEGEWQPSESRAYEWRKIWEACGRKGISTS